MQNKTLSLLKTKEEEKGGRVSPLAWSVVCRLCPGTVDKEAKIIDESRGDMLILRYYAQKLIR